ncbi:uncharacterized protein GGS25DRAFT_500324 [Hypoxylon fragiforme]|uniref:uncharacterized protein n=1 Tax=Hypoxylon fragiforme TaxID=63214 RepID=UPI0020C6E938|nr:uncharacterized protein GGS25DRAFT_500324 [Hypoxylon fragiforme]KAI2606256.1 hypothetical protein GGS25DRAFT_500324 [Hypoxylon fragiforme]
MPSPPTCKSHLPLPSTPLIPKKSECEPNPEKKKSTNQLSLTPTRFERITFRSGVERATVAP